MGFRRLRFMGVPRHNVDLDAIRASILLIFQKK